MIKVQEFLLKSNIDFGTYALVTYNGKTEPTWFSKYNLKGIDWFLESPCELYKITQIKKPINKYAKEYVDGLLEEGEDIDDYIDTYIKPMIINDVLYEIKNFQCSPYLPEYVDEINLISSRECLEYMLEWGDFIKILECSSMGSQ